MECAKRTLAALADFAAQFNAVIAVENLPRTCLGRDSKDILELLSAHDALRVCYDTNHLLGEDAVRFIEAVGDKIITTHVSDYDFLNERHWLPGEGKVNWQEILPAAENGGVEWFIIEQDVCHKDPFDSLKDSFDYLTENFVR